MVKGISKQVIVVDSGDKNLFEQAIFILADDAVQNGVTNEMLLREAKQLIQTPRVCQGKPILRPLAAAGLGALATGILWLITAIV